MKGQEPHLYHFTTVNGLSGSTIYSIAKDEKDYLWLGTDGGLTRFDGQAFVPQSFPELSDQEILKVFPLSGGKVGLTNLKGEAAILSKDSLSIIHNHLVNPKIHRATSMADMPNGEVWIGYESSIGHAEYLGLFRLREGQLSSVSDFKKYAYNIFPIQSSDAYLVVTTDGYAYRFQADGSYQELSHVDGPRIRCTSVTQIGNRFWLISPNAPIMYLEDRQITRIRFESNVQWDFVLDIAQDDEGKVWVATNKGVFNIEESAGKKNYWSVKQSLLSGIHVNQLFTDEMGHMWIGTKSNGLYCLPAYRFFSYPLKNGQSMFHLMSEGNNRVIGIQQDGQVNAFTATEKEKLLALPLGQYKGVSQDISGNLIIYGHHLRVQTAADWGSLVWRSGAPGHRHPLHSVKDMVRLGNYSFVASSCGTYQVKWPEKSVKSLMPVRTYAFLADSFQNRIWIGCDQGLMYTEPEGVPQRYVDQSGQHIHLIGSSFSQGKDGTVFMGTQNHGIWQIRNDSISSLLTRPVLPPSRVIDLLYTDGSLWCSIGNEVWQVDVRSRQAVSVPYSGSPGSSSEEPRHFALTEDYIWLTTSERLVCIPRQFSLPQTSDPAVHLESVERFDRRGNAIHAEGATPLTDQMVIRFSAVSYFSPLNYAYRLNRSEQWLPLKKNEIRFQGMTPGERILEITTIGPGGENSSRPLVLDISIPFRWWQKPWVQMAAALAAFALILLAVLGNHRRRLKRAHAEIAAEREISHWRLRALRSRMNPHFTFNALTGIQQLVKSSRKEDAAHYLADFARLKRMLLQNAAQEWIDLQQEIEFLTLYVRLEKLRFAAGFDVVWDISEQIDLGKAYVPTMILQPLVENAIIHGLMHQQGQKKLQIRFEIEDEMLICWVMDNGVGRNRDQTFMNNGHQSIGLESIFDRLYWLSNGHHRKAQMAIEDLTSQGVAGTRVRVQIPIELWKTTQSSMV
ncbi:MAG: histidine kinase [Bacteroidota bacterium]